MAWAICLDWLRLDLAARPSVPSYPSRSAVRSISSYRLAGVWRRAPFLSARFHHSSLLVSVRHSLAAGRIVFLFVSSLVSLARLVWASRVYSLRFAHLSVSSRRFAGVSLFRLARRSVSCSSVLLVVPRCLVLPGLSSPLVSPGFSLSSPCSLVSLGRLVSAARMAGRIICHPSLVSFSFLFSYHLTRCRFMAMATAARLVPCLVAALRWRNGRVVRRYGRRTVFVSSISSHQGKTERKSE